MFDPTAMSCNSRPWLLRFASGAAPCAHAEGRGASVYAPEPGDGGQVLRQDGVRGSCHLRCQGPPSSALSPFLFWGRVPLLK